MRADECAAGAQVGLPVVGEGSGQRIGGGGQVAVGMGKHKFGGRKGGFGAGLGRRQPRESYKLWYDRLAPGGLWIRIAAELDGPPGWSAAATRRNSARWSACSTPSGTPSPTPRPPATLPSAAPPCR